MHVAYQVLLFTSSGCRSWDRRACGRHKLLSRHAWAFENLECWFCRTCYLWSFDELYLHWAVREQADAYWHVCLLLNPAFTHQGLLLRWGKAGGQAPF